MKVVVTGGAGFIGSALVRALLDRGDHVVVVDNLSNSTSEAVPDGAELSVTDIRDVEALQRAFAGAGLVWHQAAIRSVPRSLVEPSLVHDTNATGTLNVLLAAEREGVKRVVYASSSSVYGGTSGGMSEESMPPRPLSPYGVAKLCGEYYCSVWAGLGRIETVSLRYFNVFGPGQRADSKYAAVFPAFISALAAGKPPEIHWDGEQSRDFTFIDDVVAANLSAGTAPKASGSIINVAGGRPRTINEVFRAVSEVLERDLEPTRVPKREGDIRDSYADVSRARDLLDWKAVTDWETAVAATVGWFINE